MCETCDGMEGLRASGELVCGSCGDPYEARCALGHWYCAGCAELMEPYDGGPATRCFRCAAGLV
jgi:ribosomal protein L37AE/L43A